MGFLLTTQHSLILGCALILVYILVSSHLSALVSPPSPPSPSSSPPHHFTPSSLDPSSPLPPPLDRVDVYSLFPPSTHPLSTTGELYYITSPPQSSTSDYLSYPFCSFTHVCLTPSSILFRFPNQSEWEAAKRILDECATGKQGSRYQFDICQCFYPPQLQGEMVKWELLRDQEEGTLLMQRLVDSTQRAGRPLRKDKAMGGGKVEPTDGPVNNLQLTESLPSSSLYSTGGGVGEDIPGSSPSILRGHYWSVHKYVARQHHIGHWAQRIVLMSSIFQHSNSIPLPPIDGLIIQDTESPLTPHEQAMLNISLYSMLTQQSHPSLAAYLASTASPPNQFISMERLEMSTQPVCVERLSFVRAFGIFSTNSHDTMAYRAVAYAQYGIEGLSHRCPPRRITLLTRANRKILNQQQIIDWIQMTYGKTVDVVELNGQSTPAEQITTFASSGLLLASHSSQLVNVVFSHPRSAMIEIAPEYYNSDFSEYAHGMGVAFRYALGGQAEGGKVTASMEKCLVALSECEGDSHCILLKRFEKVCKEREVCCKYMDGFYADLEQVKQAVQHSMNHLAWACGEVW